MKQWDILSTLYVKSTKIYRIYSNRGTICQYIVGTTDSNNLFPCEIGGGCFNSNKYGMVRIWHFPHKWRYNHISDFVHQNEISGTLGGGEILHFLGLSVLDITRIIKHVIMPRGNVSNFFIYGTPWKCLAHLWFQRGMFCIVWEPIVVTLSIIYFQKSTNVWVWTATMELVLTRLTPINATVTLVT